MNKESITQIDPKTIRNIRSQGGDSSNFCTIFLTILQYLSSTKKKLIKRLIETMLEDFSNASHSCTIQNLGGLFSIGKSMIIVVELASKKAN